MKKRILFVDDEPMVLDGLRRMLRSMRSEWEMEFLDNGEAALELMSGRPFDVVVADMRMPGMNGAELLNEVMKRHPRTARLILSGHADQELILQCVGSTHQFLSKPCDPDALKATVARASSVDETLESDQLKKLIGQMTRLPSIPSLYLEIVEQANQPDSSLEEIGRIVAQDPGMTAKILSLVNSAFFGLRRELVSAEEAVAYIGLDTIKALVLSIHAFSQLEPRDVGSLKIDSVWNHSLKVASAAKSIAQLEGVDRRIIDEAFTAGLLHDVGKLVLASNLPEEYSKAAEVAVAEGLELFDAESRVLGASHAEVAGYLLGLWGLPLPVVEAVALHHQPDRTSHATLCPLTIVHAANALSIEMHETQVAGTRPPLNTDYLAVVGVTERVATWRNSLANN